MIIRDHAKERYVERVMKITNKKEAKEYIQNNEFEVSFRIMEMLNNSELLHGNYAVSKGKDTYSYYVLNDLLIVVHANGKEIITIYDLILDLKEESNLKMIKQHIKAIKHNIQAIKSKEIEKSKQDKETDNIEYMIKKTKEQLQNLEQLKEQSIIKCKAQVDEIKEVRYENRELMTKLMFGFREFK
ncbi:hypothetical protein AAXE64_07995 [Priestia megaterium]